MKNFNKIAKYVPILMLLLLSNLSMFIHKNDIHEVSMIFFILYLFSSFVICIISIKIINEIPIAKHIINGITTILSMLPVIVGHFLLIFNLSLMILFSITTFLSLIIFLYYLLDFLIRKNKSEIE